MSKTTRLSRKKISLPGAASLLVVVMLIGQMLGFLRTMLINGNFPDKGPESTDAFFAAFKIPDFFLYVLVGGALSVALIPVLSDRLEKSDRKGFWDLSSSLLNLMAIIMGIAGIGILVFTEPLVNIVAPNLSEQQFSNAVAIMQWSAFNPLFFSLS